MSFLTTKELEAIPFRSMGRDVMIDRSARIINPEFVSIGDNVRIDMCTVVSAGSHGVEIGSHVHLGSQVSVFGGGGFVRLSDFSGISAGARIFTATDDFSHGWLRGPQVDFSMRKISSGEVWLGENCQVGANSVVLPNVKMEFNSCAGALSLVVSSVEANTLVAGSPAKVVRTLDGELALKLMTRFRKEWNQRNA